MKRQPVEWEEIIANLIRGKYADYIWKFYNSTTKDNPTENGQRTLTDTSPKKVDKWPIST